MIRYNSYDPRYRWLSNFHPAFVDVEISGHTYTFGSVEAAYQCLKQENPRDHDIRYFLRLSGKAARTAGKTVPLRPDWDQVKLRIMTNLCRAKFAGSEYQEPLLATMGEDLIHLSPWDRFWGVDEGGHGRNEHGIILMHIREELWNATH